jgi:homoserine/homoserine lactone efflux protein
MPFAMWLSFVWATLVFCLIPGPSVCFTVASTLKYGFRRAAATISGQLAANCCQVIAAMIGISSIMGLSEISFYGLKIIGALYLIYLGFRQWNAGKPSLDIREKPPTRNTRRGFIDGFVVCATNPKAVIYFVAVLPQFVLPDYDQNIQLIILSITDVIIAAFVLVLYSMVARRVRFWINREKYWKTQNQLTGLLMIIAGVALGMVS